MKDDDPTSAASSRKLFASLGSVPSPADFEQQVGVRRMMQALPTLSAPVGFEAAVLQRIGNTPAQEHDAAHDTNPSPNTLTPQTPISPVSPVGGSNDIALQLGFASAIGSWLARMSYGKVATLLVGLCTCAGLSWYWFASGSAGVNNQASTDAAVQSMDPKTSQHSNPQGAGDSKNAAAQSLQSGGNGDASTNRATAGSEGSTVQTVPLPTSSAAVSHGVLSHTAPKARVNKKSLSGHSHQSDSVHIIRGIKIPKSVLDED